MEHAALKRVPYALVCLVFLTFSNVAFAIAPTNGNTYLCGGEELSPLEWCQVNTGPGQNSAAKWCEPVEANPRVGYPDGWFTCQYPFYYTFGGGECGDDGLYDRGSVLCAIVEEPQCNDPSYPNGVDTDSDGTIDECLPECTAGDPAGQQFFDSLEPAPVCTGQCMAEATTGTCNENTDGSYYCLYNLENTGANCIADDNPDDPPDNCTTLPSGNVECDCTFDNSAWCEDVNTNDPPPNCIVSGSRIICVPLGEGTPSDPQEPSTSSGGSDGSSTGGNSGAGDGDPDTPDADGTGDGDTDEDGERDVDCNPLSNPDCKYAGSATWSSTCMSAPACNGDPVECANLLQNWNTMCATIKAGNQVSGEVATGNQILSRIEGLLDHDEPIDTGGVNIDQLKAEAEARETEIKEVGGTWWELSEGEDGSTVITEIDNMETTFDPIFGAGVGGSCPQLTLSNHDGLNAFVDPNEWAHYVRGAATFVLWGFIAWWGWILFFRMAK